MSISGINNPSAVLQAQNAYNTTNSRKAALPDPQIDIKSAESFHTMVNKNFNSFAKMNPEAIIAFTKQIQNAGGQSTANTSLVAKMLENIPRAIRKDEEVKKRAMIGEASLTEVIAATSEAKAVLQTAVAVRNKMLEAFEKIMSMQV